MAEIAWRIKPSIKPLQDPSAYPTVVLVDDVSDTRHHCRHGGKVSVSTNADWINARKLQRLRVYSFNQATSMFGVLAVVQLVNSQTEFRDVSHRFDTNQGWTVSSLPFPHRSLQGRFHLELISVLSVEPGTQAQVGFSCHLGKTEIVK